MALSLSFTPGSIVDTLGNGLTQSTSTVQVQTLVTVPTDVQNSAIATQEQVNVLSWILIVIIFLMMIKCSYPLIVLIDLLQMLHMHLYITINPLPYFWMTVMSVFSNI